MAFGKRHVTTRAPESAKVEAPHGRKRVIPAEMWDDGKAGQMLRTLGFSPDDESNLVPNPQSVAARLDLGRAALDARVAAENAKFAGQPISPLRPFFLIPDPCWNGETGALLMMRLDLFPYDDWNVVLLPADEQSALLLDLPMHPNGNIPAFIEAADKFMSQADFHLRTAHADAEETHDFARFGETREEIRIRVRALAHAFLTSMDEAWKRQRPAGRA